MAIVTRGGNFRGTFKAAATLSTLYQAVYISAADTVAAVTTQTNYAIGTVAQKSTGGAGTAVGIDMFLPSRKGLANGTVTAGNRIMQATGTANFVNAAGTLTAVPVYGIAVTTAASAGEEFEFIPVIGAANAIVLA